MRKLAIYILSIYVFLLPLDSILVMSGEETGATYTRLLSIATIIIVYLYVTANKLPLPKMQTMFITTIFIVYGLLSYFWATDPELLKDRIFIFLNMLLFYLAASVLPVNKRDYQTLVTALKSGSSLAVLYLLKIYFIDGVTFAGDRASMIYENRETDPNQFAFSLLLPLALTLDATITSIELRSKMIYTGSLVLIATGIVVTGSRGGMLGMLTILSVYLLSSLSARRIVIILSVIASLTYVFEEIVKNRFEVALATGGAGRLDIWEVGIMAFIHKPILGYGLSNFPAAYDMYRYINSLQGASRAAHSIFLSALVELGLIGVLIVTVMLISHYKTISKINDDYSLPLKAAFCGMLVQSLTLDVWWRKSFWILLIFINIAYFMSQRTENE